MKHTLYEIRLCANGILVNINFACVCVCVFVYAKTEQASAYSLFTAIALTLYKIFNNYSGHLFNRQVRTVCEPCTCQLPFCSLCICVSSVKAQNFCISAVHLNQTETRSCCTDCTEYVHFQDMNCNPKATLALWVTCDNGNACQQKKDRHTTHYNKKSALEPVGRIYDLYCNCGLGWHTQDHLWGDVMLFSFITTDAVLHKIK